MLSGYIKLRSLPLLSKSEKVNPVQEYVAFLKNTGYLLETTPGSYKLVKKMMIPRTMDENERLEKTFYQEFKSMIEMANIAYNGSETNKMGE